MRRFLISLLLIMAFPCLQFGQNNDSWSGTSEKQYISISKDGLGQPPNLIVEHQKFMDGEYENNAIDAGEVIFLMYSIKNKGMGDAKNVRIKLSTENEIEGIQLPPVQTFQRIAPNDEITVKFKVKTTKELRPQKILFKLTVSEKRNFDPLPNRIEVISRPHKKPDLAVINQINYTDNGNTLNFNETISLRFDVKNQGDGNAKNVSVALELPDGIELYTPTHRYISLLKPHYRQELEYKFAVKPIYGEGTVPVKYTIKEASGAFTKRGTLYVKLYIPSPPPPITLSAAPIPSENTKGHISLTWITEREIVMNKNNNLQAFHLNAKSSSKLMKSNFRVFMDGQEIDLSGRSGEAPMGVPRKTSNAYELDFYFQIKIPEGRHNIDVEVKNGAGEEKSKSVTVYYSGRKPNLYILAVGTDMGDLEYTDDDARDFANHFQNQKGNNRIYGEVFITTVLGEVAKQDKIKDAVKDLAIDYNNEKIRPNDVVMIFLSSHGYLEPRDNNEFRIQATGFLTPYYDTKSIRYRYILETIKDMDCKKIILIDACRSGSARDATVGVNRAIDQLNQANNGVITITSSSEDEKSHEHSKWENGLFTQAVLEAFSIQGDTDGDSIIYIDELEAYIKKRVPAMCIEIEKNPQNPQVTRNEVGNVPIYVIKD